MNEEKKVEKSERKWNIPIPGPGRPKGSVEKPEKKALKVLVQEYRERLANSLEKIDAVLVEQALKGNMSAIRELNEVVGSHAPKKQDITSDGKGIQPVLVQFLDQE